MLANNLSGLSEAIAAPSYRGLTANSQYVGLTAFLTLTSHSWLRTGLNKQLMKTFANKSFAYV